ncbi:MAG: hypothetical protein RR396_07175, partial [Clostridiales bacterium]
RLFGGAKINGFDKNNFYEAFAPFWESRANLRNNPILTDPIYQENPYPGIWGGNRPAWPKGQAKGYPVFKPASTDAGFYIYPNLSSFEYHGATYYNPHLTPWEYIDAYYDATLKYYEKYTDDSIGTYYLDLRGNIVDNLKNDGRIIVDDGYYIEVGKEGTYKVVINGHNFNVKAIKAQYGDKFTLSFDDKMKAVLATGYNKIRVFTTLPESPAEPFNAEDNKINRLLGTSTIAGSDEGKDLYCDFNFPKEIKFADAKADKSKLKPAAEK